MSHLGRHLPLHIPTVICASEQANLAAAGAEQDISASIELIPVATETSGV